MASQKEGAGDRWDLGFEELLSPLAKAKKMNNRGCSALASQENTLVKYIFFGWSHVLKQAMKAGEDLDIELFKDNAIKCEEYNCNGVMADRLPELVVLK